MNLEVIVFVVAIVPFFWVVIFKQDKLKDNQVFLKCLMWTSLAVIFGIAYEYPLTVGTKSYVYYISQMGFIFVILYKLIRIPYYRIYNREPEIADPTERWIDIIPTVIVFTGTLILPFLIDEMIVQKIME